MLATFFQGRWVPIESRFGARAAAIACAIVINWCIRNIGHSAGADYVVLDQGQTTHITYIAVANMIILTAGVGWVVLAVLERLVPYAKVIWTIGALAILALTALPITASHGSIATKVFLGIMNTVTVAAIVPVMLRTARPRPLWSRQPAEISVGVSSSAEA